MSHYLPKRWKSYEREIREIYFSHRSIIKFDQRQKVDAEVSFEDTSLQKSYIDFWKFAFKLDKVLDDPRKMRLIEDRTNFKIDLREMPSHLNQTQQSQIEFLLNQYFAFRQKASFNKLRKMQKARKELPVASYQEEICRAVTESQFTILAGDTGCGKSTQVPQYIYHGMKKLGADISIACTQPRRIAAISLAKRVGLEMASPNAVGYQVRFDKNTHSTKNRLTFLTEGLLLRKLTGDPLLTEYSVVILDEVHERHIHCDVLLGCLMQLAKKRPNLRVILMSATIQLDLYKKFVEKYTDTEVCVIQVPGRLYPIEVEYLPPGKLECKSETVNRAKIVRATKGSKDNDQFTPEPYLKLLELIDKRDGKTAGDLLIFLPGISEIETVCEVLFPYSKETGKWIILPLHSTLTIEDQDKCFRYAPPGVRKCIVATNIAETSVTFDGIRYVADSGKEKQISFDEAVRIECLKEQTISRASSEQRKGRAGRTGPGICFRMYSEKTYDSFQEYTTPEIHRLSMESTLLQIISLQGANWRNFAWLEDPEDEALESATQSLIDHSCLEEGNDVLTPIGEMLSKLPVDITIGKMLLYGKTLNVSNQVVMICATLAVQCPFTRRSYQDPACFDRWRDDILDDDGDPFTLYNAFQTWLDMKNARENTKYWCQKRAYEERRFYEMINTKSQFESVLDMMSKTEDGEEGEDDQEHLDEKNKIKKKIRELKRRAEEEGRQKKKLRMSDTDRITLDMDGYVEGGRVELSVEEKIMHLQFMLRHGETEFSTVKNATIIKMVLACAMYPNIAIGDSGNTYNQRDDKIFFHTVKKNFVSIHPNGVYGLTPQLLAVSESGKKQNPENSSKKSSKVVKGHKYGALSSEHQVIVYTNILETIKPYVMNCIKVPALQMLMLCCKRVDVAKDFSRFIFDKWIEVQISEKMQIDRLRSFLQNAILVRVSLAKQAEQGKSVRFLEKLSKFMGVDVRYYLGKLGPVERSTLVQEDGVRDDSDCDLEEMEKEYNETTDYNMFEFIEETTDWLFINTVESLCKRGDKKDRDEERKSSKNFGKRVHPSAGVVQHLFGPQEEEEKED